MKPTWIFTFFVLFCGLVFPRQMFAQTNSIGNEYIKLCVNDGKVNVEAQNKTCFSIEEISLPGTLTGFRVTPALSPEWGKGECLRATFDNGREVDFTLYPANPFLHISTSLRNSQNEAVSFKQTDIATFEIASSLPVPSLNAVGSSGLQSAVKAEGSYLYSLLADPQSRNSIVVAWLTQLRGIGTIVPQLINRGQNERYTMTCALEFGNMRIEPGQTRETDVLMVGFFDDGRQGLELFGSHMARAYDIKLPPKPDVYCTWYHMDQTGSGASTEAYLTQNTEFAKKNLSPFGLNVMQIDDHWQDHLLGETSRKEAIGKKLLGDGPVKIFTRANSHFPSGMEHMASVIKQNDMVAGIWFTPFSGDKYNHDPAIFAKRADNGEPYTSKKWSGTCIDVTNPAGEKFLRERFRRIYDWGYRYFKIDGLHTGAPSENLYVIRGYNPSIPSYGDAVIHDSGSTFTECFRKAMSVLRQEAPDAFLLGCNTTQNMGSLGSSIGYLDAMRVGPDNGAGKDGSWKNVTKGADFAGNMYFMNNKVWYNDPDPYYVRVTNPLNKARWMVSWQSISGAMSSTSEQYSELPAERLDLIKRGLPTHNLEARPIDILESSKPRIWMVSNRGMHVIGLFNWSEQNPETIDYPMARAALKAGTNYELFDFWEDRYLGTATDRLNVELEPASCRVLAVREQKSYPQVISTSRHITQGLIDIVNESWDAEKNTLSVSSEVVAGDPYQLRIVVPESYSIRQARCGKEILNVTRDGHLARTGCTPKESGRVEWIVTFVKNR